MHYYHENQNITLTPLFAFAYKSLFGSLGLVMDGFRV